MRERFFQCGTGYAAAVLPVNKKHRVTKALVLKAPRVLVSGARNSGQRSGSRSSNAATSRSYVSVREHER